MRLLPTICALLLSCALAAASPFGVFDFDLRGDDAAAQITTNL